MTLAACALVLIGGFLGGIFRFFLSGVVGRRVGETFPWGTLVINILGSFVIGIFGGLTGPDGRFLVSPEVRIFVMVGLCGGYTTFSSFSLQTLALMQDGEWARAGANVVLSVVLCLLAVWLGVAAAGTALKGV